MWGTQFALRKLTYDPKPLGLQTQTQGAGKNVACGSSVVIIEALLRQRHIPLHVQVGRIHFHSTYEIDFCSDALCFEIG